MRALLAGVALLGGCDSVFGLHRDRTIDAPGTCYGKYGDGGTGLLQVCLEADPVDALTGIASLDTDAACDQVRLQDDFDHTELCVVAARTIDLSNGLRARGSRPLVLVATETLVVGTVLDASSTRTGAGVVGPGGDPPSCDDLGLRGSKAAGPTGGGGGGAGGSLGARGGDGGSGSVALATSAPGGTALPAVSVPLVRGGCHGGGGGDAQTILGGARGEGGGAVYLIAGLSLRVDGAINASGGAGSGGVKDAAMHAGGGGGGGSGGLIGLDAPHIVLAAGTRLVANGAGGGGGGGSTEDGFAGKEPDLNDPSFSFIANGGAGGNSGGAQGGAGGATSTPGGGTGINATAGAGGGGGSAGVIRIYTTDLANQGAAISPAPGP